MIYSNGLTSLPAAVMHDYPVLPCSVQKADGMVSKSKYEVLERSQYYRMLLSFSSVLQLGCLVLVVRVIMRTLMNTVCICSSHPEAENKGQVVLMRDQARQLLFMWANVSHSHSCTYTWNSREKELLGELLNEGRVT